MVIIINLLSILLLVALCFEYVMIDDVYCFAVISLAIFLINTVMFLYKYRKGNIICIELMFSISFLFSTFQYPFLLGEFDYYTISRYFSISNQLYHSGMGMANLGYLLFLLGSTSAYKFKKKDIRGTDIYKLMNAGLSVNYMTLVLFIVIIIGGGWRILFEYSGGAYMDRWVGLGGLWHYLFMLFIISTAIAFIKLNAFGVRSIKQLLIKLDKVFILNMVLVLSFFLISGYRSQLLSLFMPIILMYSVYIRRIGGIKLFLLLLCGLFVFVVIGDLRGLSEGVLSATNISSYRFGVDITEYLVDYVAANGALYHLIDYVNVHGAAYGSNVLLQLLAVIPFVQSLALNIFNLNPGMQSSLIFTEDINGPNYLSGLGTNIIGDLYYSFGFIGVLVFMFLFGLVSSWLYRIVQIQKSTNLYYLIPLCILFGNSLFFVRVEYFFIFRMISFSLLIYWLINLTVKRKAAYYKHKDCDIVIDED